MSRPLKKHLFKAYGGFGDKRIKNLDKGKSFIIDNRAHEAMNTAFCMIFAEVVGDDQFSLTFQGNFPYNDKVKELIKSKGGKFSSGIDTRARIGPLTIADIGFVQTLSNAIKSVTSRPYEQKSWKYSTIRVSGSLETFIDNLKAYRDGRSEPDEEPDPDDTRPF